MATRATLFPEFLVGIRNPNTDSALNAGLVYFYSVGTTTEKTVWNDADKTSAVTQPLTLSAFGQAEVYGEGEYKVVIKTAGGGSTLYTWDDYRLAYPSINVQYKTTNYTASVDDDLIVCSTSLTVTLPSAATARKPLTIKVVSGTVTVARSGSDTIDGNTSKVISTADVFYPRYGSTQWYSTFPVADADTLNGYVDASTPGIDKIVRAESDGKINPNWIDKTDFVAATDSTGFVELATNAETTALTDTARAVTPSNLAALLNVTAGGAPIYSCRAWVVFDGTGTPAITADGNITSITDVGTGNYEIVFDVDMPDENYAFAGIAQRANTTNDMVVKMQHAVTGNTRSVSALEIVTGLGSSGATVEDSPYVAVIVFR